MRDSENETTGRYNAGMQRVLTLYLLGAVALLLLIQVFRPERSNPSEVPGETLEEVLEIPGSIGSLLQRSCYDCHSNRTQWPWYSGIAPFSWVVADDVHRGRRSLNFSEWGRYDSVRAAELLEAVCREVEEGGMPLPLYTLAHRRASLSEDEVEALCDWARRIVTAEEEND